MVQYVQYFAAIFQGDLGMSMRDGRPAFELVMERIPATLALTIPALFLKLALGVPAGVYAALHQGTAFDRTVMVAAVMGFAVPSFVQALVLAFFGNSLPLLIGLMGLYGWERYARIARGLAVSASVQGNATAITQLGATPPRDYLRHILPNIASTLIVSMTLIFPEVILLESGLSFLGLGVQPPMTSLGNMVGYGREYITRAAWIMLCPATVIVLTTLAVSLVGDWLRDRLDPTLG